MSQLIQQPVAHDQHQDKILDRIVDALISVQDQLIGAGQEEWDAILRAACREQRDWSDDAQVAESLLEPCCG